MNRQFLYAFAVALAWTGAARGQGLLINVDPSVRIALPRPTIIVTPTPPPSSYKIKELSVQVRLVDQVAKTQVSQSFVNTGSRQMEVCFVFPLPYDGAVDQLTLLVDGKEYPAKLLPASEARAAYEQIVRMNRDPALLEWMGMGMFKTSVFPVPPGAERKVTLRYSQLCRKEQGVTDFLFPLSTAKYTSHPVEKVDIRVAIESSVDIKNVYSPTHSVEIKRPDNRHAEISLTSVNEIPTSDLRLLYDVGQGQLGASVLSYRPSSGEDGYFLLLASPDIKAPDAERPAKTVIFVLDRSGSMSGDKIEQAKGALRFVLNNLREGDLFNIVAYDSQVESFRSELQRFNDDTRKAALGFVAGLYAGGSTNLAGGLQAALGQLKDSSRPSYVIFLTDGLPTDGETNETKIVTAGTAANGVHARVFTFGVGYDVNSRLLDKLARENFGQSEFVRPNENLETRLSSFYARIASPVMTDVSVVFSMDSQSVEQGDLVNRRYPAGKLDLFASQQLVLVGRYKQSGAAKVFVTGKVGQKEQKLDFPANLVEKSSDDTNAYIAKLWAMRRVGEIIDQIDLKGKNDELVKELVQLATQHGLLTPYTSFLADERTNLHDRSGNLTRASGALKRLDAVEGESAFRLRGMKGAMQKAAAPAAPAEMASEEDADRFGAGGGAYLNSLRGRTTNGPQAGPGSKREPAAVTVQSIGRKTFYRRGNRWIDSDVSEDQEKKAKTIRRFSDEYFALLRQHGNDVAKYFTFDEPVVLKVGDEVYSVTEP